MLTKTEQAYVKWLLEMPEDKKPDEKEMQIHAAMQQKLILEGYKNKYGLYRTDH